MQPAPSRPPRTDRRDGVHPSTCTAEEAQSRLEWAVRTWWRDCDEATVRAHPQGYAVELGAGRHRQNLPPHATLAAAEAAAIEAVRAARHHALGIIRTKILPGWPEDTPFLDATLGTAMDALPIRIRRAPCANDELGTDAEGRIPEPPVVAIYQDGAVIRTGAALSWDDDASRAAVAARHADGKRRKEQEVQAALRQFAACAETAHLVLDNVLACTEVVTAQGERFVLLGPVRLDAEGIAEARVSRPDRSRTWLSLRDLPKN